MTAQNKRMLQPGERIRVLVVDDSVVVRRLVAHALQEDPLIELVGAVSNGEIALQRIPQLNPDVMILDIEMPIMDGLETLKHLRLRHPQLRVIMFSTLTDRGAAITLEALSRGADDYATKVSNGGSLDRSMAQLREQLIPKVKQFFHLPATPAVPLGDIPSAHRMPTMAIAPKILVIGVSTGGPNALGEILPTIPGDFPLPILLVQHMPPMFTRLLAERLDASCKLPVHEAQGGEEVAAGKILIAPGDYHMKAIRNGARIQVLIDQTEPQHSCRPAVDPLFTSVAQVYGGAAIAVILTGMGSDGLHGVRILKEQGATILAQNEQTSVVWGMPRVVVNAGLADMVLPLNRIVPEILNAIGRP